MEPYWPYMHDWNGRENSEVICQLPLCTKAFSVSWSMHLSEDALWLSVCTVVRGHLTNKGYLYVCLQLLFVWASVGCGEMWGVWRRMVLSTAFPAALPRWLLPAGRGGVQPLCLDELLRGLSWCELGVGIRDLEVNSYLLPFKWGLPHCLYETALTPEFQWQL